MSIKAKERRGAAEMLLLLRPTRIRPTKIYLWPSNARIHKHAHVCTHSLRLLYFSLWLLFNSSVKKIMGHHLPIVNFRRARQEDPVLLHPPFPAPLSPFPPAHTGFPGTGDCHFIDHILLSLSLLLPLPPQACPLLLQTSPNTPVVREL